MKISRIFPIITMVYRRCCMAFVGMWYISDAAQPLQSHFHVLFLIYAGRTSFANTAVIWGTAYSHESNKNCYQKEANCCCCESFWFTILKKPSFAIRKIFDASFWFTFVWRVRTFWVRPISNYEHLKNDNLNQIDATYAFGQLPLKIWVNLFDSPHAYWENSILNLVDSSCRRQTEAHWRYLRRRINAYSVFYFISKRCEIIYPNGKWSFLRMIDLNRNVSTNSASSWFNPTFDSCMLGGSAAVCILLNRLQAPNIQLWQLERRSL